MYADDDARHGDMYDDNVARGCSVHMIDVEICMMMMMLHEVVNVHGRLWELWFGS